MKFLVLLSLIAFVAAAEEKAEEQPRDKRGLLGLGAYPGLGYPSLGYHGAAYPGLAYHGAAYHAPLAVGYHQKYIAPIPAVKYVAPLPAVKVVQPAYAPYAKLAYPGHLYSPYGHDALDHGYGLGHYGYGHGYGYGGYLH